MLNNNQDQIRMVYSLLFTLPGTPVLRYGDEIGMGEDLSLEERNSVRTAMQWSTQRHGGFSAFDNKELPIPVISDGEYGYEKVNAHSQMREPSSLLNWMERAISARKECMEFGWGEYHVIKTNNPCILAHACRWKNGYSLAFHNLSDQQCVVDVELDLQDDPHLVEHFSDREYEPFEWETGKLSVSPFGYRWFRKSTLFI